MVICALLVIAGMRKIMTPRGARESVALIGVSAPDLAIRGLGVAELAVGVVAAVSPTDLTGFLVAIAYGAFAGFALLLLIRNPGRTVDCGCFGGAEGSVGWLHVTLNAMACGIAATTAGVGAHGLGWILGRSPLIAPPLFIGLAAATYAAYLAYTLVPRAWGSYGPGAVR